MKMTASSADIEEFLGGPLISWLASCLPEPGRLVDYSALWNGYLLNEVVLQIDPEPPHQIISLEGLDEEAIPMARVKNFDAIVKNIKALFEEELGQTLLVIPECICLGKNPETKEGLENMRHLILLLLGAAVQCPNKEIFITRIKELDVHIQHGIVECIKQVTDNQSVVLTPDSMELFHSAAMYNHMRRLAKERDHYLNLFVASDISCSVSDDMNSAVRNIIVSNNNCKQSALMRISAYNNCNSSAINSDTNHLAVELADWKARLRKQRQELEEKSEQLAECKEELEHTRNAFSKLKSESQVWCAEARKTAVYRDEVDALRERAERADRLELDVQKYREKLVDMEFYKARESELREDNRVLMETREMLEEQLQQARRRADKGMDLQHEIVKMKQRENDVALERDMNQQKIQELIEENAHLHSIIKATLSNSNPNPSNDDGFDSSFQGSESGDNSLSEQLTSNAQARALKLELENKRLLSTIETLKEQSFHESSDKFLELEKEKKKLALKCEQLQESCSRLTQQNLDLENIFKNALEENGKLQDTIDSQKNNIDRMNIERDSDRSKVQELDKHLESVINDKQKVKMLCDSIQRRAEDLERSIEVKTNEIEILKPSAEKSYALEEKVHSYEKKITSLEKENSSMVKDVTKLKECVEEKDKMLDKLSIENNVSNKEIQKFIKEAEIMKVQVAKMQEIEKKSQELISQQLIHKETIEALQKDLVEEKVHSDKVKMCMEKLGLNTSEIVRNEIVLEDIVEIIFKNNDIQTVIEDVKSKLDKENSSICYCQNNSIESNKLQQEQKSNIVSQYEQISSELAALQTSYDQCQAENAKLQVLTSTLSSQNTSLASQQITLQLANSQLAVEKEDIIRQLETLKTSYDNLLKDQQSLQSLHEQLNSEYESIVKERESLKSNNRDMKGELRDLKEENESLQRKITNLTDETESLKIESRNLINLRKEHSKLKEDFRNLFSASDRLKNEYRHLQEEYRNVRTEASQLKLRNTEMSGELSTKTDITNGLELELNKITQRCEMLMHMNVTLDADRRSLMDHVSCLLTQYHELLAHSMEDKQHYHQEEKMFADKLNNLCRQKEKLEEKIMEHYRKLDNCTPKKKSFGSNLVKRVRKAGSDLISKVPTRHGRRSWSVDENAKLSQSQPTLQGSESGESDPGNSEEAAANSDKLSNNSKEAQDMVTSTPSVSSLELPRPTDNFARKLSHSSFHGSLGGGDDALIRASLRRRQNHTSKLSTSLLSSNRNSFQGFDTPESSHTNVTAALCRAGSRRAVYLAEDNSQPTMSTPIETEPDTKGKVSPDKPQTSKTFLVYNRISTVIGDGASQAHQQNQMESRNHNLSSQENGKIPTPADISMKNDDKEIKSARSNAKETAIWYEYGCV